VELLLRSCDESALAAARHDLEAALGEDLVCVGEGITESVLLDLLRSRGETLALAESMTGGLIAARLTAVPGSSDVLSGGAVVYSAQAKAELAGLDPVFIAEHGTVSEQVTRALAENIRKRLNTTWGLAVTGTAGPTEDKAGPAPVGTCLVAVAGPNSTRFQTFLLPGDRTDIHLRSASWALDFLRRCVLNGQASS
jgi:nicotinamide-nucleotide amidase